MDIPLTATHSAIVLLIVSQLLFSQAVEASPTEEEFRPVESAQFRVVGGGGVAQQKNAAPFQLCLACKCCSGGGGTNCVTMPCCFGINCQLPNKPFGVCAFLPKSCNCNSCAL